MTPPTSSESCTTTGATQFGSTWRSTIRQPLHARARGPRRRSRSSRRRSAWARISRVYQGHQVTAIAIAALPTRRREHGREREREQQRREGEEDVGDAHDDVVDPAAEVARDDARAGCRSGAAIASDSTAMRSDVRAPNMTRLRTSRPTWSVPNGCDQLGAQQAVDRIGRGARVGRVRREPLARAAPSARPARRSRAPSAARRSRRRPRDEHAEPAAQRIARQAGRRGRRAHVRTPRTRGSTSDCTMSTSRFAST